MAKEVSFMPSLFGSPEKPSFFDHQCNASLGYFEPYVSPDEASSLTGPCESYARNIVSCKDQFLPWYLHEVDGLDFDTVKGRKSSLSLPRFIPIIPRDFFDLPSEYIKARVVGISLTDLVRTRPRKRNGRCKLSQSKLRIRKDVLQRSAFAGKKVVLLMSGPDILIEDVWREMIDSDFLKQLPRVGADLCTAINFSLFPGECPVAHALNLKKSLKSIEMLTRAGIPAVPHVYQLNTNHTQRWIEWLRMNPVVRLISVNCQFSHDRESAKMQCAGVIALSKAIGPELRFLLEGPSKLVLNELAEKSCLDRVTVATKGPLIAARNHRLFHVRGLSLSEQWRTPMRTHQILPHNLREYAKFLENLTHGVSISLALEQLEMAFNDSTQPDTKDTGTNRMTKHDSKIRQEDT
jgi:hypothetical protein